MVGELVYDHREDANHVMLRGCVLDYPYILYAGKKSVSFALALATSKVSPRMWCSDLVTWLRYFRLQLNNSSLDFPPNEVIPSTFPGNRKIPAASQAGAHYFTKQYLRLTCSLLYASNIQFTSTLLAANQIRSWCLLMNRYALSAKKYLIASY